VAARARRIAVLGANLAGLEFARAAAARGHHVQIVAGDLPLGGLLGLRAGVPGNAEFGRAFLYFGERLNELGVGIVDAAEQPVDLVVDCRPAPEERPAWAHGKGVLLAGELLGRDLHQLYGIGRRVAVAGPGALAGEVALFLSGWGRRPWVIVPGSAGDPFPDVHPMHAARLLERLEGYKVPLVTGATPLEWRYDEDRKSTLRVLREGREDVLQPFHSAVSAAGWPLHERPGSRVQGPGPRVRSRSAGVRSRPGREGGAFVRWPAAAFGPRVPEAAPDGTTIVLGDTPYAEPLRDLVAYAHLLARRI
jgi:NADPH-dependent 2,4-dienoyl-CoA reductase/sulfur reductase-like enzyme